MSAEQNAHPSAAPPPLSSARGVLRIAAIASVAAVMAVPVLTFSIFGLRWRHPALRLFYRAVNAIAGLRVEVDGDICQHAPTLYAANHVSYLDILFLGSALDASFVSKAEVLDWPAIGWFAHKVGTTFIERNARRARHQVSHLGARLRAGDSLVLFPEGSATDGQQVLPFKSTLFAALSEAERVVVVQPLSLLYWGDHQRLPLSDAHRLRYAWFGDGPDSEFGQHAWRMLCSPGVTVRLQFHAPVHVGDEVDRKAIARLCEEAVAKPFGTHHDRVSESPRRALNSSHVCDGDGVNSTDPQSPLSEAVGAELDKKEVNS